MTSDINGPLVSHCFLFTMALKGMEPTPNPQLQGGSRTLEGGSFKFVTLAPKHEGKATENTICRHIQIIKQHEAYIAQRNYCTYTSVSEISARVAWPIPVAAVTRLRRQRRLWPRAAYKQRTLKVPIRGEHYADRGILSGFARCFPPSARLGRTGKILATWFYSKRHRCRDWLFLCCDGSLVYAWGCTFELLPFNFITSVLHVRLYNK